MIQLFMEPPLFHDNRDYATNLFAGYSTKTTEKRQNQPQMSQIKTDLNREWTRMDANIKAGFQNGVDRVRNSAITSRLIPFFSTAPRSISHSRLFASIRGWYFICVQRIDLRGHDEVIPMQGANFMGPQGHGYASPFRKDRWMMAFLLGERTDAIAELEGIGKILEMKNPF
jgi:hypothetical protein